MVPLHQLLCCGVPAGRAAPIHAGLGAAVTPMARGEMGSSSPALKLLSPGQAGPALAESHPCHIDRRGLLSMHSTRRGISPLRLPPARPPRAPSCSKGCGFLLALLGTAPRSQGVPGAGSPAPRCCHLRAQVVRSWGSPGGVAIGPSPPLLSLEQNPCLLMLSFGFLAVLFSASAHLSRFFPLLPSKPADQKVDFFFFFSLIFYSPQQQQSSWGGDERAASPGKRAPCPPAPSRAAQQRCGCHKSLSHCWGGEKLGAASPGGGQGRTGG